MASVILSPLLFYAHATIISNFFSYGLSSTERKQPSVEGHSNTIVDDTTEETPLLGLRSPFNVPSSKEADRITSLPGLEYDPGFDQFAGYLTVNEKHERRIFYWYVESQGNPAEDPVVLWTNGGPGCSGMVGFGTEHGPYYISASGDLSPNPYSWNKLANILYVEQPSGVGFSYSERRGDYKTGDHKAASDNYKLILAFLERFPERKENDFYISSESYGGHYMPQLTKEILDRNVEGDINFKGMMVGNPYVDPFTNSMTMFQEWYHHGVLPWPLYNKYVGHCSDRKSYMSGKCQNYMEEMYEIRGKGINPYALDFPVCLEEDDPVGPSDSKRKLHKHRQMDLSRKKRNLQGVTESVVETDGSALPPTTGNTPAPSFSIQASKLLEHTMNVTSAPKDNPPFLPDFDRYRPCAALHLKNYLNRPDVVSAIHANSAMLPWEECSRIVDYSMKDASEPQIELYRELVAMMKEGDADLQILIFSGDDDSVCSLPGTQVWIWDLGVKARNSHSWKPWEVANQTAGFVTRFHLKKHNQESSLVFATVHGAGHEVPAYRPREALELFRKYLHGDW